MDPLVDCEAIEPREAGDAPSSYPLLISVRARGLLGTLISMSTNESVDG